MSLALPTVLDSHAAAPLRTELLGALAAGGSIELDGAGVTRVGQACLQVLIAAEADARAAGLRFAIAQPSGELADACALAGMPALAGRA